MKTKEKIAERALALFNEKGTDNISTRNIADDLGMSVGNLHYHFPTKTDLIRHLHSSFLEETDKLSEQLLREGPQKPDLMYKTTERTFQLIMEYQFLFRDRLTISLKIPEVTFMFKDMLKKREAEFNESIALLIKEGLLRKDLPDGQYRSLFLQIAILYNSWISNIDLFEQLALPPDNISACYAKIISDIWIPYFSEKGLKKFQPPGKPATEEFARREK